MNKEIQNPKDSILITVGATYGKQNREIQNPERVQYKKPLEKYEL